LARPGLEQIVRRKRIDLALAKERRPLSRLTQALRKAPPARDFAAALRRRGEISLVAELKKASPSAGLLRPRYDAAHLARCYARAGARALSVLTEERFFQGDLSHLATARAASGLPVLRKDFLFDEYQLVEARAAGADAALLIAALLDDGELKSLLSDARRLGLTVLVEAHDAEELDRVLASGAKLVGVNSRNLKDLSMDPGLFRRLVPRVPAGRTVVAESGLKGPEDVRALAGLGVHAVLVGESILRSPDVEAAARGLAEAGKEPTWA
jgi:indole-3-glycerol phosphate synthase